MQHIGTRSLGSATVVVERAHAREAPVDFAKAGTNDSLVYVDDAAVADGPVAALVRLRTRLPSCDSATRLSLCGLLMACGSHTKILAYGCMRGKRPTTFCTRYPGCRPSRSTKTQALRCARARWTGPACCNSSATTAGTYTS